MLTEKGYCDYETCVALKELGFREKCVAYYDTADNVGLLYNTQYTCDVIPCQYDDLLESRNSATEYEVDAPTLYDAQKWLREEKGIIVGIIDNFTIQAFDYYVSTWEEDRCRGNKYTSYEDALQRGIKEAVKILKEGE